MHEATQTRSFGLLLKRYRRAAGLTQETLAERAGYSTTYLSKLERGERQPLPFTIEALADALGLTPDERAALAHAAQPAPASSLGRLPSLRTSADEREGPLPLVGRANELALLHHHLAGEGPPLLLLLGEPGIGKTHLLQEAASQAQRQGWHVLEGGCHRHSAQEPYAPLLEALERSLTLMAPVAQRGHLQGCDWLIRLLPDLAEGTGLALPAWTVPPAQERRLLFAAVRRFLDQSAGPAGTLLVLDDLHWAGADALDLLASLLRAEANHPLRMIGSYRSTEVQAADPLSQVVADLAREGRLQRMEVGPLAPSEATALLQLLLQGTQMEAQHPQVETILQRTGGVPYFLVSCAQGLQSGALDRTSSESIPWVVTETIRQRVSALSEAAQYLLGAVAVAGNEARRPLVLAMAAQLEWGKREALSALEQACQARLLVEAEADAYRFAHDLIRDSVGADLSATRRALLHQQVAEWLEQRGGELPNEALAHHYLQAGLPEKALRYLEQAGDRAAAMYAHAEAEHFYHQWADVSSRLGRSAGAAQAQEKLAEVLTAKARYSEALVTLAEAQARYQATHDLEGQARVVAAMGRLHAIGGTTEEGIGLVQPWLEPNQSSPLSVQSRGTLYVRLSHLYRTGGRYEDSLAAAEQAVVLARQAQDEALLGQALLHLGTSLMLIPRPEEGIATLEAAFPFLERTGDLRGQCYSLFNLALAYGDVLGDFRKNHHYAQQVLPLARQWGDPVLLAQVLTVHAVSNVLLGEWQQPRAEYEEAIELLRQTEKRWGTLTYALINLGELLINTGEVEAGKRYQEEAISLAEQSSDFEALPSAQMVLAEWELVTGRPQEALARLESLLSHMEALTDSNRAHTLAYLAWTYLELGRDEKARHMLDQAIAVATAHHLRRVFVETLPLKAKLTAKQEEWEEAARALDEAMQLCREMPWPYAEAKTLYVAGQIHTQREEYAQARTCLEEALAICQRLGEHLYAEPIQQALEQLPPQDQPSSTPGDGEAL